MLKLIFAATILIASDAFSGEIVFRSPMFGTLAAVSHPAPTQPAREQPVFRIRYEPVQVAAGTSISIMPIGDVSGYTFAARNPLPPGLVLNTASGKIVGLAAVVGNYSIAIRSQKDGAYLDLKFSINIS